MAVENLPHAHAYPCVAMSSTWGPEKRLNRELTNSSYQMNSRGLHQVEIWHFRIRPLSEVKRRDAAGKAHFCRFQAPLGAVYTHNFLNPCPDVRGSSA